MKTITCIIVSLIFSAQVFAQANFSGTWKLNESKSQFGGQPTGSVFSGLKVTQTDRSLTITGSRDNGTSTTALYPMDGSNMTMPLDNGRKMAANLKWTADKTGLTRYSAYYSQGDQPDYSSTEEWRLTDGGKALILTRTFNRNGNAVTIKAVYDKTE